MNPPSSRQLVRYSNVPPKAKGRKPRQPDGAYSTGLHNPEISSLVGRIVTTLPHIEERLIEIMALLLGDKNAPAHQVLRALTSEDARVKVLRALLERSPINKDRGREFDEIIDLFVEIKKKRHNYAHGLWSTHESGRTFLAEPSTDQMVFFVRQREVRDKELNETLRRMDEFFRRSMGILYPDDYDTAGKRRPSPQIPPEQPRVTGL